MRRTRSLLVGVVVVALFSTGCVWSFETLDGHQNGPHGQVNGNTGAHSDALMYNGRPHVFYYSFTGGDLRHAWFNGSFWVFETLDGHQVGPTGQINATTGPGPISAILYNGRPHVFYVNASTVDLRHAYFTGTGWGFETLDGHQNGPNGQLLAQVGRQTAATLYNGRPHVFYYDEQNLDLRHGYWNGVFWAFETLDGNANGPNGRVLANTGQRGGVVVYAGRPHVFYYDDSDLTLRHAYYNGAAWIYEDLDGNGGPNGRIVAEVGASDNSPVLYGFALHVFYRDNTNADLRHAYNTPYGWDFETLDGHQNGPNGQIDGGVGVEAEAVVVGNRIRVFHFFQGTADLRHSYYTGSAWGHEMLDGHQNGPNGRIIANTGQDNAAIADGSKIRVFSWDLDNNDLRHGWFG